jgi:dienelactone hydrolase
VVAVDAPGHGDRPRSAEDEQAREGLASSLAAGDHDRFLSISLSYGISMTERAVPEWQATLDALQELPEIGPIGYGGGVTLGTAIGVALAAIEPRITAAIFGNGFVVHEGLLAAARKVTVPIQFLLQWDDEHVDRDSAFRLFEAFGSAEKTMHANFGGHGRVPWFEQDSAIAFFHRHFAAADATRT